jgi:hypothetical protein
MSIQEYSENIVQMSSIFLKKNVYLLIFYKFFLELLHEPSDMKENVGEEVNV